MTTHNDEPTPQNYLRDFIQQLVPAPIAERAIALSVTTDASTYAPGESVEFTVIIRNCLPVPVTVATADRRIWSWDVDGFEEASDERRYVEPVSNTIEFGSLETKRFTRRWDGRIRRAGEIDRWTPLSREEHRIRAWMQLDVTDRLIEDEARFRMK